MKLVARGALIWAAWTLYAFFAASQSYISAAYASRAGAHVEFAPVLLRSPRLLSVGRAHAGSFLVASRLVVSRANWWWTLPLLFVGRLGFGIVHVQLFGSMTAGSP